MSLLMHKEFVDAAKPGDRVKLVAVLRHYNLGQFQGQYSSNGGVGKSIGNTYMFIQVPSPKSLNVNDGRGSLEGGEADETRFIKIQIAGVEEIYDVIPQLCVWKKNQRLFYFVTFRYGALAVAKSWLTKSKPILVYDLSVMSVLNSLLRVDALKREVDEQRFVDAKAELADLRAKFSESERFDFISSILHTIGRAYEDMQTHNQHLMQHVMERVDYNIKVTILIMHLLIVIGSGNVNTLSPVTPPIPKSSNFFANYGIDNGFFQKKHFIKSPEPTAHWTVFLASFHDSPFFQTPNKRWIQVSPDDVDSGPIFDTEPEQKELWDSLESKYMAEDSSSKKFLWIDSGATTHVCKDCCWFKTYEPMEDGFVLYMGDDHFAPAHGKGSVALEFSYGKTISLFNVLYVPKLPPYTPQQNGMAEMKNGALKEMVNSMLSYSSLSEGFWGEAILTACYLLNMVPNKKNKTTTYELWYKKRPNLAFLRVWGCRAVVRLPDPKRKTVFVGYAEHYKAYRDDHSDDVPNEIPKPHKGKRVRKAKSYGSDFQLYLVEGLIDQVGLQYSYSIEENPRTYNEAMQSRDFAF
uniref:Retrovirus-related Pol polyprotein from transposon TNT 1-94-like beta-barrel domain-containing protein n=1 Tax=Tanacetum cinerariifolium TaxID=118510 RepID=A0A6L2NWJ8_TANCI|nr:hypothetical protein [Tanacetum cinerariifolium]